MQGTQIFFCYLDFSSSLPFSSLTMICVRVDFFVFIFLEIH